MAKFLDKTQEWDDLIEQWHSDETPKMSLSEFLGLNETEYLRPVHDIDTPDLYPAEVLEESRKRTAQAVVGLTIQEMFKRKPYEVKKQENK